ncbi:unnamed protein product [Allacma fusca]|uniref:Uncharacterized protein n=1 Tax=Allacma fusca TaxID=39272 RepID=A0A8J2JIW3_9HEXA|nr:unnamed protein product [Allacma fusca]
MYRPNPLSVIHHLTELANGHFQDSPEIFTPEATLIEEKEIAYHLFQILQQLIEHQCNVETRTSIEYEDSDNEDYFDCAVAQEEQTAIRRSQQTASQEWEISEIEVDPQVRKQFTLEEMKDVVACYDGKGGPNGKTKCWTTVQKNFRQVKHRYMITRFREYIARTGTRDEKWGKSIYFFKEKFDEALRRKSIIHDSDFRAWGVLARKNLIFQHSKQALDGSKLSKPGTN